MTFNSPLRRLGAASPLVPVGGFVFAAVVAKLAVTLLPEQAVVVVLAQYLFPSALLLFFVVVTWYRDDDWLAAGFLLSSTVFLVTWIGEAVDLAVSQHSLSVVMLTVPGTIFTFVLRAVTAVPLSGAIVTLARWVTGSRGRASRANRPGVRAHRPR